MDYWLDIHSVTSDVLAWLLMAWAFKIWRPGQSRQWQLALAWAMAQGGKCLLNRNIISLYHKSCLQPGLITTMSNKRFNVYILMLTQCKMCSSWSIDIACLYLSMVPRPITYVMYHNLENWLDWIKLLLCILVYLFNVISLSVDVCWKVIVLLCLCCSKLVRGPEFKKFCED